MSPRGEPGRSPGLESILRVSIKIRTRIETIQRGRDPAVPEKEGITVVVGLITIWFASVSAGSRRERNTVLPGTSPNDDPNPSGSL